MPSRLIVFACHRRSEVHDDENRRASDRRGESADREPLASGGGRRAGGRRRPAGRSREAEERRSTAASPERSTPRAGCSSSTPTPPAPTTGPSSTPAAGSSSTAPPAAAPRSPPTCCKTSATPGRSSRRRAQGVAGSRSHRRRSNVGHLPVRHRRVQRSSGGSGDELRRWIDDDRRHAGSHTEASRERKARAMGVPAPGAFSTAVAGISRHGVAFAWSQLLTPRNQASPFPNSPTAPRRAGARSSRLSATLFASPRSAL